MGTKCRFVRSFSPSYVLSGNTDSFNLADHPPFRKFQDAFWASEDIRQTEVFNYRYLPGNVSGLSEGDSIREWTVRIRCKKFEVGGNFSVLLFLKDSEDPEDPEVPDVPPLPANPNKWFFAPTFIGAFDTFVNDTPEECTNCQEHAQDIISGFVHINESITKNRYAGTLDPVVVEPFLTKRLNWRVLKVGIVTTGFARDLSFTKSLFLLSGGWYRS